MPADQEPYLGIKGPVVRGRKWDGKERWRTPLKGRGFANVVVAPDGIYAYSRGILYALEPNSGAIRRRNELPGLGHDVCTIGSANQTPAAGAAIKAAHAQAAASNNGG